MSDKPYPTDEQFEFLESMKTSWKIMELSLASIEEMAANQVENKFMYLHVIDRIKALRKSCRKMYNQFDSAKSDMSDLNY